MGKDASCYQASLVNPIKPDGLTALLKGARSRSVVQQTRELVGQCNACVHTGSERPTRVTMQAPQQKQLFFYTVQC